MKIGFSIALTISIISSSAFANIEKTREAAKWDLVWSDEFDGPELDTKKWKPEKSCWGGGNNERQCYTGRKENIRVTGGHLRLIAREERFTGPDRPPEIASMPNPKTTQPFTSGKIRTRGIAAGVTAKSSFVPSRPKAKAHGPLSG